MDQADQILERFGMSMASRGGISIKFGQKIDHEKPPPDEIQLKDQNNRESFQIIDP